LNDRVRASFVALEAWFDRDEEIVLLDQTKSDKSARCTNVPVDVSRRRYEDQTIVGCGGCCAELGKRGVEEGVRNRQAREGSSKNDNVEWLVHRARDVGCSRCCACVACLGRWIDSRKGVVVGTLRLSCCGRVQKLFVLGVRWR